MTSRPPPKNDRRPRSQPEPDDGPALIPVAVVGLGQVGRAIARAVLAHPQLQFIGACDSDKKLQGQKLSTLGIPVELPVVASLDKLVGKLRGGALLVATSSEIEDVAEICQVAFKAGVSVVSTCEALAYPWLFHEELADPLEAAAKKAKVSALGIGAYGGVGLERLISVASAATGRVDSAKIERTLDLSTLWPSMRKRAGYGMGEAEFDAALEAGTVGVPGLAESCALAALGLGLDCDEVEEEVSPVIAEEEATMDQWPLKVGQVAGVYQLARGFIDGREVISVELTVALGAEPAHDRIEITGDVPVTLEIKGARSTVDAVAYAVVNAVPSVVNAEPGLLTVLDLPAGR
jgi:4-hydroxy-tetrahydrodipicolinate reductase